MIKTRRNHHTEEGAVAFRDWNRDSGGDTPSGNSSNITAAVTSIGGLVLTAKLVRERLNEMTKILFICHGRIYPA